MKLTSGLILTVVNFLSLTSFSVTTHFFSDSTKAPVKKMIYRGSVTKENDLIHTRLDVKFDWQKSQMEGKAAITASPHFYATSKLELNARGMEVKSLEVIDLSAGKSTTTVTRPSNSEMLATKKLNYSYKYENDTLKINLGREFAAGEKYMVKVNYIAKPNDLKKGGSDAISEDKGLYFINPTGADKKKMPQIWTQGETEANSAWFPTVDNPNEKMTSEIFMTVDAKYTTLSNGLLTDTKKNADGTKTDHWKMDLPHSPYLVMMAVGEFSKITDAPWNGKEVSYYVEKEYVPYAKGIFGNTKEMIDFYSKVLGTPYPWAKYAQIVVRDYVSGAMENTSATLHGDFMVYQNDREMLDGKKGEDVIAHELFHQWFGDLVTAESWSNLPLNESFATYGEYLWEEYKNGRDAADAHSYQSRMGYFGSAQQRPQVDLIRYHYETREDMFDAWSYNKGGQVLHMLRKYVGDKAFFASLKLYLERNRFKNAEIHDLRLAFEEVTGKDLNWFFNQWFLAKGHPDIEIEKSYNTDSKTIKLKVKQNQDLTETPLYNLPVDVDIYSGGKKERHRIIIDDKEQQFNFVSAAAPDLVNFDAERQLLGIKTYTKTTEELIFMYKNAPLFSDRFEALQSLKSQVDKPEVYKLYLDASLKDNWFEHRILAIQALKSQAASHENELKPQLIQIAKTDKHTKVRAAAIKFLGENYKGSELSQLYQTSISEKSYAIISEALTAMAGENPVMAMQKAKELEVEKNDNIFNAIAAVYIKTGGDDNSSYFVTAKDHFSGYGYFTYIRQYGKFLKRCNNPTSFVSAAIVMSDLMKNANNEYVSNYAKKTFEDAVIGNVKTKQEELKTANAPANKITELQELQLKLEAMLKESSGK